MVPRNKKYRGKGVYVVLPVRALREVDALVEKGEYLSRTHLVRRAVEQFLEEKGSSAGSGSSQGAGKREGRGEP